MSPRLTFVVVTMVVSFVLMHKTAKMHYMISDTFFAVTLILLTAFFAILAIDAQGPAMLGWTALVVASAVVTFIFTIRIGRRLYYILTHESA